MNNERESDLTIPYVNVGDYYLPNFSYPRTLVTSASGAVGARSSCGNIVPSHLTCCCCPVNCSSTSPCSIRKLLNAWKASSKL